MFCSNSLIIKSIIMQNFWIVLGVLLGALGMGALAVIRFLMPFLVATFIGLLAGWFVGLFFGGAILAGLASLGVTGLKMWQIGAIIGFVCGLLKRLFK